MGNKQTLKDGIVFLVLIIIGVILYYRVIHFGFIDWDDNFYVVHNQYITAITLSNIVISLPIIIIAEHISHFSCLPIC